MPTNSNVTKEEVLYRNIESKTRNTGRTIYDEKGYAVNNDVEEAMDMWAKRQAIEFIVWAVKNYSVEFEGFSLNFFTNGEAKIFVNHEEITIEQLYNLFLEHQKTNTP